MHLFQTAALRWLIQPVYNTPPEGTPPGNTPPAGNTPPPGNETWYGKAGVAQEHHEWLGSKQFADPSVMIASYRSLESTIGRNRLAVPNNAEDTEAYNAIYKTLGRPDKPDDYKLPEKSKISGDEWKMFAPIMHKHGASPGFVNELLTAYEERAAKLEEARETERAAEETRQIEKLDKEWGSNKAHNTDIASRAFRALGIDEDTADKIEGVLGYEATMKLMHKIGSGMGEARLLQDGKNANTEGLGGNLAHWQGKLSELTKNQAFMDKYNHHDPRVRKGAIEEMEAIQIKIAELSKK